ncbi:MAG: hypothetical protein ACP5N1_00785 [Candidatus Woesearchaeota archaeon]
MNILIFVHNNNSGIISSIKRKINSVSSKNDANCKLYTLIHNKLFIKRLWKNFLNNLSYQKVFFHRKEFKKAHPEYAYLELPAILLKNPQGIKVLITASEINSMENIDDLIGLIGKKLM